ncbi:YcgN family cysteine cluster protein [Francisella adeliensis]|uniref:YcgN family cysteine cluster protein n=1 Tax=Francisella adeliensis TaxID=2007306 RepID=A0A2Z4XXH2_9GAMM|nr:YcgN family cysteine cluster protein [Francisella adeliensis]AXA33459.1 hypothetical protein CDH04_03085 [Francisella adeliensis]MBK2085480.1 YcgN family cysteine cluster protein [Francisella adeliensis]MBK2097210.1 YcgN family cysteine cluster protein [Francisella adeliensis]QIW11688.1 YcgN family cysteine cluster protein [Francisella adeliensis]QIW13562.1 YcgN family cysteine cluster protein [Francisella adeliensis]
MHKWWQEIELKDMDSQQWESICDRCGLCCLNKLQDDESDEIFYTRVSCKLLDTGKCQCSMYEKRKQIVPDCINLTYKQLKNHAHKWLPNSCAYKLLLQGDDLPDWHHLNNDGSTEQMHAQKKSAKHFAISEYEMGEEDYLEDFIIKLD